jgi:hypothetical protein
MFLALASCTSKQGDKKYQVLGWLLCEKVPRVQPVPA